MINVYKIGGNIIDDAAALSNFLREFKDLEGKKILVHGGGKEATRLGKELGHEARMIDGRRVTDEETLKLVTMVYAGLINKRIVSQCQEIGCDAIGLTGADGNLLPATRRSPVPFDFGFVGDLTPEDVNIGFLKLLLKNNYVPVVCAICRNPEGGLLNCNADTIASTIAVACSRMEDTTLTYCFEKRGVLRDISDESSLVTEITPEIFESLLDQGIISEGMIPKVTNALKAIRQGVKEVRISQTVVHG